MPGPPTLMVEPSTVPLTPIAVEDWKSVARPTVRERALAAAMMALASGCSLSPSAAAAHCSNSASETPPTTAIFDTTGSPMVSVPVLSKSTELTVRMPSSASRSLIRTPPRAARSVAIDTTRGMARPSAWGQAMTSTVTVRITASFGDPTSIHTTAVMTAEPRANQKSHPAAVSASRWARDVEPCASVTSRWMPARAVSSPIAVIRTRSALSVATVPATTWAPTLLLTARDSPVTIDSSTSAVPSVTSPSAGTLPPGRTTTTSPTASSEGDTVTVVSPSTRSASSGSKAARESRADEVCASERISIQ